MVAAQRHTQSTVCGELISCVLLWGSCSAGALGTAAIACLLEAAGSALPFCCCSSSRAARVEFCLCFCIFLCWRGEGTSQLSLLRQRCWASSSPRPGEIAPLHWWGGSTCLRALCSHSRGLLLFFFSLFDLIFSPWAAVQIGWEMGCVSELDQKLATGPLHMQFDVCSPSWSIYSGELSANLKLVLWKLTQTFFKCFLVPAVLAERSSCTHQCIDYTFLLLLILVKDSHDRCPGY